MAIAEDNTGKLKRPKFWSNGMGPTLNMGSL